MGYNNRHHLWTKLKDFPLVTEVAKLHYSSGYSPQIQTVIADLYIRMEIFIKYSTCSRSTPYTDTMATPHTYIQFQLDLEVPLTDKIPGTLVYSSS